MTIKRITECSLELAGPIKKPASVTVPKVWAGAGGGGSIGSAPIQTYPTAVVKWSMGGDTVVIHQDGERVTLTRCQLETLLEQGEHITVDLELQ